MGDSFEEYEEATKVDMNPVQYPKEDAPKLPSPDSPELIPELNEPWPVDPPPKVEEKVVYKEKIVYQDKIIYEDKIVEKKVYTTKNVDLSRFVSFALFSLLIVLIFLLLLYTMGRAYNYSNSSQSKVIEKIVHLPSKTSIKYVTKWKTKWRTKYKTKWKTEYKVDTKLTEANRILRDRIVSLERRLKNKDSMYKLHRQAIRGFFRDVKNKRSGSLEVRTR